MSDFTVYSYQCCPLKVAAPKNGEIEHDEFVRMRLEENETADTNMKNHQQIIGDMLTLNSIKFFRSQKQGDKGHLENCTAFLYDNKIFPFIRLIPKEGQPGNGIIVLRIAKLGKKKREQNWHKVIDPHEPSALVIIDNRYDHQRVLIEHRSEWGSTDAVRNVVRGAIDKILRKFYRLTIRIEPVYQKSDFWVALRKYEGHIRSVEFDVGYPNMGRTGNKLLYGIKEECKLMYASPTMRFSVPKEATRKKKRKSKDPEIETPTAMTLDPDYQTGLMGELWENCRENGRTAKLQLDNKRVVHFGRKPQNVVNSMSEEERKVYEMDIKQMYSTSTFTFSLDVSNYNGNDDLFDKTYKEIEDGLTALSSRND